MFLIVNKRLSLGTPAGTNEATNSSRRGPRQCRELLGHRQTLENVALATTVKLNDWLLYWEWDMRHRVPHHDKYYSESWHKKLKPCLKKGFT